MAKASEEAAAAAAELRQALVQLEKFVQEDAPKIVGEEYVLEIKRAIDEKRSPDGKTHDPLAPASMYPRKSRRNPGNHVLKDTLAMYKSADKEITGTKVEIFLDGKDDRGREPAVYHQTGTAKMPQRQVLTLSNTAGDFITKRLLKKAKTMSNTMARKMAEVFANESNFGE